MVAGEEYEMKKCRETTLLKNTRTQMYILNESWLESMRTCDLIITGPDRNIPKTVNQTNSPFNFECTLFFPFCLTFHNLKIETNKFWNVLGDIPQH